VHWVVPVAVVQREARFDKSATDITSRRCEQVITGQRVAVAAEHCADFIVESACSVETFIEQRSGRVKLGPDMNSSSVTGWEEFGRPHLARTVPNLAQPG
jgi:hypothetical protein